MYPDLPTYHILSTCIPRNCPRVSSINLTPHVLFSSHKRLTQYTCSSRLYMVHMFSSLSCSSYSSVSFSSLVFPSFASYQSFFSTRCPYFLHEIWKDVVYVVSFRVPRFFTRFKSVANLLRGVPTDFPSSGL